MTASDLAQWVGAALPLLLLVILPFVRWAVRSGIDDKLAPLREEMSALRNELRDHVRNEDRDVAQGKLDVREVRQRLGTVEMQQATMIGQLKVIQQRGELRRKEDE